MKPRRLHSDTILSMSMSGPFQLEAPSGVCGEIIPDGRPPPRSVHQGRSGTARARFAMTNPWRAGWFVVGLGLAIQVLTIWWPAWPPLVDLPNHAARHHLEMLAL